MDIVKEREDKVVLKILQISDTHISSFRNLLEPMISHINQEPVDIVVVTGDVAHNSSKESLEIARSSLNKIRHRVVVLPGDYDGSGDIWGEYFGERRKSVVLNGYCLDFLDTSFVGHRYAKGWGDVMRSEDPEQHEWLLDQLTLDKYHFIFSHHPICVTNTPNKSCDAYLLDNVRALYSGHMHDVMKLYFDYRKPRSNFTKGFCTVPMGFHGNSCYLIILVKDTGELINIPKVVSSKVTAW